MNKTREREFTIITARLLSQQIPKNLCPCFPLLFPRQRGVACRACHHSTRVGHRSFLELIPRGLVRQQMGLCFVRCSLAKFKPNERGKADATVNLSQLTHAGLCFPKEAAGSLGAWLLVCWNESVAVPSHAAADDAGWTRVGVRR